MKNTLLALTVITSIVISACVKSDPVDPKPPTKDTVTLTKRDTIYIHDTVKPYVRTKTEILTYKPWIIQEEYEMEGNTILKYERGATGNTVNYDNEVLTFNVNNTGTFHDIYGANYPISWSFANTAQTKMNVNIMFPTRTANLKYNMVQLSDSSFSTTFSQVNLSTGQNVLVSVKRVWKDSQ